MLRRHTSRLWRVNLEAWRIYQALCGRTVGVCELHGALLSKLTEEWPVENVIDLLARLDLMLDILRPEPTPSHGRT